MAYLVQIPISNSKYSLFPQQQQTSLLHKYHSFMQHKSPSQITWLCVTTGAAQITFYSDATSYIRTHTFTSELLTGHWERIPFTSLLIFVSVNVCMCAWPMDIGSRVCIKRLIVWMGAASSHSAQDLGSISCARGSLGCGDSPWFIKIIPTKWRMMALTEVFL